MEAEPDKWDRAHIRQQLTGFDYLLKQQVAERLSQHELIVSLRERIKTLESGSLESDAKIGELSGELAELQSKHATMAAWIKERLKNGTK